FKKSQFQANFQFAVDLPAIIGIADPGGGKAADPIIGKRGGGPAIQVTLVSDLIVAGGAIAATELAITEYRAGRNKGFFGKDPGGAYGAEITETPTRAESGGTVPAEGSIKDILVAEIVVGSCEKGSVPVEVIGTGLCDYRGGGIKIFQQIVAGKTVGLNITTLPEVLL